MVEKKKGILESLDKLGPEDWEKAQKIAEKSKNKSDAWLKGLIEEHEKKGPNPE